MNGEAPVIDWEFLRKKRITVATLVMFSAAAWYAIDASARWHVRTFVTIPTALAATQSVTMQIETNAELLRDQGDKLDDHITEFRLQNAIEKVDLFEERLYFLERDTNERGQTPDSDIRKKDLENDLKHAIEYRDCLLNERPNCEILKRYHNER